MSQNMIVFLTGGTGFLGSAVLPKLLRDSRVKSVLILIRGSSRETAEQRLKSLLCKVLLPHEVDLLQSKVMFIEGDLESRGLGMSCNSRQLILDTCTHVLHVGASTDFSAPLAEARKVNVQGTQEVIDLVLDIQKTNKAFERFDYVSTAFVAGTKPGVVTENTLARGQKFANSYEQSKYEAEELVRSYMKKISTVIHRPSIVVGDSRNGFTPHFKVLYWPLLLLSKNILPFIPCNPMARLDVVPVDFVADSMHALLMTERSIGQTFHLTCGAANSVRIHDFLNDAFSMTSIVRKPLIPLWMFHALRSKLFNGLMSREFWEACELAAVYSEYLRGTDVTFDNSSTVTALNEMNLPPAPSWSTYKANVFNYCIDTRWGKRKSQAEYQYRNPILMTP